jgi:hypothetical protein
MYDISIQIPVLNRPRNANIVASSIFAASQLEIEVLFVCSRGDHAQYDACAATGEDIMLVSWEAGPGDFAKKHNAAYHQTTAPYVLLGADDLEFDYGWDVEAMEVASNTHAGVIGTQDEANPLVKRGKHSTHPIVARDYIDIRGGTWHDGPGVVLHEGYAHQYVDTELVACAISRGEWAFARRSVVRHLHPMYPHQGRGRTPMDDTYRKALGDAAADNAIFVGRQRQAVEEGRAR